jgi:hypothetical protein
MKMKTMMRRERTMLKWWMLPSRERARAMSTSLLPYPKTSQDGNYRHHDLHPLLLYPYLQYLIRRLQRESGRGRRAGGRHHTFPVSSHPSQPSVHPSNPSPFRSLLPEGHQPHPRSFSLQKSSRRRPSHEYRPPTPPIIRPSSHTHFLTSHQLPSGTYLRP